MKKITFLFLLVFLTTTSLFAQLRDSIWWSNPYFQIVYSEVLEQPKWIQYRVACPNGKASRSGMDFYKEKGIKTSDHKDYEHNVWDKGHMVPAASFSCNRDMIFSTFTYMNCALQHQSLNRGVWKHLEIRERELANQWPIVDITIRVVFDEKPPQVKGGASIPKGFYKIIKYENVVESYYFPNQIPTSSDYNTYRIK
jgi:DNA/RNA endonuclease G (NUC1)